MSEHDTSDQPRGGNPSSEGEADAGRMLQILWRGKWILLCVPLLTYAAAKLWLGAQTELFVATAQIQVDSREVDPLRAGAGEATNKPRTVLKQQQGLLKSTPILKRIAEAPALAGIQSFAPARLGDKTAVGDLYENLQTTIDIESDRLILSYTSPFRDETAMVVEEAVRVYLEHHREKKREQAELEEKIVRGSWEADKKELEAATHDISELQAQHDILAGADRTQLQARLDNANAALNAAHASAVELSSVHEEMVEAKKDPARFLDRGRVWRATRPIAALEERFTTLKNSREQKQEELERLRRPLGESHARLVELRTQIAALQQQELDVFQEYAEAYLLSSEVDAERARLKEQSLRTDVQSLVALIAEENSVLDRITNLKIQRDQLRDRVAHFDERMAQLRVENQTGALNLDVIEPARAQQRPAFPDEKKTMVYALGSSAILAFGLVMLMGLSDRRVREVEDVPKIMGAGVLGVLPQMPHGSDQALMARLVEEDPQSLVAEAMRSVRTATTFALPNDGRGIVLVTSAGVGEGKSVCASNLAFALASGGKKTLLLDADMRRSSQHKIYAVEPGVGLAGLLASSAVVKRAIASNVAYGLDLLPAGDPAGKAAELCEGPVLIELLQSLRASYECIVIDAPPVLETSETRLLASLADVVVFVLRLDESRAPDLKRAAGILRSVGARILGCLANGASSQRGARAYAGGIAFGQGQSATALRSRPRPVGEPGLEPDGRGTDFLGLDERESA